jgi:hypothetical protein
MRTWRYEGLSFVLGMYLASCGDVASSPPPSAPGVDAGAIPFAPAGEGSAPDPMLPGPFPVGVMTVDLLDESREGTAVSGDRFLRTEIWYPAMPSARGAETWSYDFKEEGDDPNIDLGDELDGLEAAGIAPLQSGAVRDAPIDNRFGPYPVVLFSHGAYSTRFHYSYLTVHLASHGFIVAAPDHSGNTLWDMIRDGMDLLEAASSLFDRAEDLLFVRNQLVALGETRGHALFRQIETVGPAGVVGHSLGGLAALMAAQQYDELSFYVALAPLADPDLLWLLDIQPEGYGEPAMILGSMTDETLPYADQYCAYLRLGSDDKYLFELTGGGHFSFSEECNIDIENPPEDGDAGITKDGCDPSEEVPFETAQRAVKHYAAAFCNRYIRHSTGTETYLVDRDEPPFDTVNFYIGQELPDWPGGCP